MCFGGDGGAGAIAQQQRADEVARQARIKTGMDKINSIFDGSATGATGVATSYDPSKTYYYADGKAYVPATANSFFGAGNLGVTPSDLIKQGKLFTTQVKSGGFGDDYYQRQANNYSAYATPQLDRAYGLAKNDMVYALDRSGILQSKAAIDKNTELTDQFDQSRLDIANKAQDLANQSRQNVENVRSNLVTQLNATGDDQAAANGALRQAQALSQPQTAYSPLSNLFSSFSQGLSTIGSNSRNNYGGFFGSGGLSGLFSSGGSSKVVR